jgi:hypothetical protein
VAAWRRWTGLALLLLTWLVAGWIFALVYVNADIGRYYLVPLLSTVVLGALGASALWDWLRGRMGSSRRMVGAFRMVGALVLLLPLAFPATGRYQEVDEAHDTLGREWLTQMVQQLPPKARVVSWWSYSTPLWYAQLIEGRRPDISIIDDRTRLDQNLGDIYDVIDRNLPTRPVYVIRVEPSEIAGIAERYETQPLGGFDPSMLARVIRKREAAP